MSDRERERGREEEEDRNENWRQSTGKRCKLNDETKRKQLTASAHHDVRDMEGEPPDRGRSLIEIL